MRRAAPCGAEPWLTARARARSFEGYGKVGFDRRFRIFDVADYSITLDYNERYTASENYTHSF